MGHKSDKQEIKTWGYNHTLRVMDYNHVDSQADGIKVQFASEGWWVMDLDDLAKAVAHAYAARGKLDQAAAYYGDWLKDNNEKAS